MPWTMSLLGVSPGLMINQIDVGCSAQINRTATILFLLYLLQMLIQRYRSIEQKFKKKNCWQLALPH